MPMPFTNEDKDPPVVDWGKLAPLTESELGNAREVLLECLAVRPGVNALRILNLSDSFRATYGVRLVAEVMRGRDRDRDTGVAVLKEFMRRVAYGYQDRNDWPPFALAPWDDRNRYVAWLHKLAQEYQDELRGSKGAGEAG